VTLDLDGLPDAALLELAMGLMNAAVATPAGPASVELHRCASEVYEVAVQRAERRAVEFAERLTQVRVRRVDE
jgi:hypothetical protein